MPLQLYSKPWSPSCRIVLMVLKELNIEADIIDVDLVEREQKKEAFLKINPQHKIPTIIDDGFVLCESRAICAYLCDKFGGEKLYPKDLQKRATIEKLLYFDCGTLYSSAYNHFTTQVRKNIDESYAKSLFDKLHDSLCILNEYLSKGPYLLGDNYTLPDLSIIASVALLMEMDIDFTPYPNVTAWVGRLKTDLACCEEVNETKTSFPEIAKYHKTFDDPKYSNK